MVAATACETASLCDRVCNRCEESSATSSLASLFSKRFGTPAGLFENAFEDLKLLCVRIGKHSADFRGVLVENWDNQVLTALRKCDDSNPPISRSFRPADQPLFEQAIDRDADGAGSQVHFAVGPLS